MRLAELDSALSVVQKEETVFKMKAWESLASFVIIFFIAFLGGWLSGHAFEQKKPTHYCVLIEQEGRPPNLAKLAIDASGFSFQLERGALVRGIPCDPETPLTQIKHIIMKPNGGSQ